jgi:hypothetical protein
MNKEELATLKDDIAEVISDDGEYTTRGSYLLAVKIVDRVVAKVVDDVISANNVNWKKKLEGLQGKWAGVAESNCPDWVLDLRFILFQTESEKNE